MHVLGPHYHRRPPEPVLNIAMYRHLSLVSVYAYVKNLWLSVRQSYKTSFSYTRYFRVGGAKAWLFGYCPVRHLVRPVHFLYSYTRANKTALFVHE
ncbi:hypothetical protein D3C79_907370 [compost metagenome]